MTHLKDHIELLIDILKDVCVSGSTVPKADIYEIFNQRTKRQSDIEKYRFSKEISELINSGHIKGYHIKVGRNGGIAKDIQPIKVRFYYPNGDLSGSISPDTLTKIVSLITKEI